MIDDLWYMLSLQAWYLTEAMEAIASIAPGLCLGALSKVPIEIYRFLIEVPFAKEKSPCPFKYELSGLSLHTLGPIFDEDSVFKYGVWLLSVMIWVIYM